MLWLASIALQPRLSTRQHAIELRDRGYTVIPDAGINPSLIAEARAACLAEHEWLLKGVAELGIDTTVDKYAFAEIDKRHRLRWSLKPSRGPSAWTAALDEATVVAADVIEEAHRLPANTDDSADVWTRPPEEEQPSDEEEDELPEVVWTPRLTHLRPSPTLAPCRPSNSPTTVPGTTPTDQPVRPYSWHRDCTSTIHIGGAAVGHEVRGKHR